MEHEPTLICTCVCVCVHTYMYMHDVLVPLSSSFSSSPHKALDRYIALWDFLAQRPDELSLQKVTKHSHTYTLLDKL